MGQIMAFILLTQIATNGWWWCATQQASVGDSPLMLIPLVATAFLLVLVLKLITSKWGDSINF